MHRLLVLGVVAAASVLGSGFGPWQSVPSQKPKSTGVVVGVVVDRASGTPIPDTLVTVELRTTGVLFPAVLQRVITDPTGRFAFTGLPSGTLLLRAIKAGYAKPDGRLSLDAAGGMAEIDLHDGERITNATLSLSKYASISGRVIDDLGDPVVGVTVRAHRRVYWAGHPRLEYPEAGRTDDRGMYRIATLTPGDYVVAVPFTQVTLPVVAMTEFMATGYANRDLFGDLIRVTSGATLSGGDGLLGGAGAQRVGNLVLQAPPDTYLYPPDPNDARHATAYQTTFAPSTATPSATTTVTLQSGEQRTGVDVQLTLVPTVTVSGSVMRPDGPAARAGLRLVPASGELPDAVDFAWATAMADASGAFTFLNVPAGQYVLRATKRPALSENFPETYAFSSDQALTVGDVPIDGVRVALRAPMRVTGTVKFEGATPPAGAELARLQELQPLLIVNAIDKNAAGFAVADASFSFASREVPAGRYVVTSTSHVVGPWSLKSATWQGQDVMRSPFELKDGDISGVVATFTDRPARITGTVRNAQGAPDKNATVLLFPADPGAWSNYEEFPLQTLDGPVAPSGAYKFPRVLAGDYFLVALVEAPTATSNAIDVPGLLRDWRNPAFMRAVSGVGVRVHVADGEAVTQDLKTTVIR